MAEAEAAAAEGRQLVAEEAAAQLDEVAELLQAKLEECDGTLAELTPSPTLTPNP